MRGEGRYGVEGLNGVREENIYERGREGGRENMVYMGSMGVGEGCGKGVNIIMGVGRGNNINGVDHPESHGSEGRYVGKGYSRDIGGAVNISPPQIAHIPHNHPHAHIPHDHSHAHIPHDHPHAHAHIPHDHPHAHAHIPHDHPHTHAHIPHDHPHAHAHIPHDHPHTHAHRAVTPPPTIMSTITSNASPQVSELEGMHLQGEPPPNHSSIRGEILHHPNNPLHATLNSQMEGGRLSQREHFRAHAPSAKLIDYLKSM